MLRIYYISVVSVLMACYFPLHAQSVNDKFPEVYQLILNRNFFKAKDWYALNKSNLDQQHQQLTEAILDNAFNKPAISDQKVTVLLQTATGLPDSLLLKLHRLKEDNAVKQYKYKEAKVEVITMLKKFAAMLSDEERDDLSNNLKIWTALENVPPQRVSRGAVKLKMFKDNAGLNNLKMTVGMDTADFIFDTGANISTVSASTAKQLHFRIIPSEIAVNAITGKTVTAQLAVCDKMMLGDLQLENVVFLVLEDEGLSFPSINYYIHGILGYAVIAALREIQITRDNYFIVPETETEISGPSNMAIDGLTPLICIDGMHFTFDTGAGNSILYAPFYQRNRSIIDGNYSPQMIAFGGAGGKVETAGFKVKVTFNIMDKKVTVKNVNLLQNNINQEKVYGNIGQDVIRQFSKMTMNFDKMFIRFD
ncbi:aspartyl protease [Chitinophaga dinghuensis]|uniref:Aspartyl protease n=1 Tax=Chitinophaga dinghuensis TaxID=1539050 RepID=A0A327VWJ2_9BACT|nr:retropepsin-like aspartic protease [Chitinophaga dinghuensis]RAJ80371.1 aspartyl protease [Chitinophaga dinghuensis]